MRMADPKISIESFNIKLIDAANLTLSTLKMVWLEAGYQEDEQQRILASLLLKLTTTMNGEITNEQQILEQAKIQVSDRIREYINLSAQLGRSVSESIALKGCVNVADKLARIEKLVNEVTSEVNKRQSLLDKEMLAVNSLRTALGEEESASTTAITVPSLTIDALPLSDARLRFLQETRASLERLRNDRIEQMRSIMAECHSLMKVIIVTTNYDQLYQCF
jgi:hypothetical protein